jgi:NADH dehydrogenase
MAEVRRVDRARRVLVLADAEIPYDALILAPGAVDQWFGHDEWTAHAPGLKSLEDALEMRSRMLRAFEGAERETDAAKRAALLTFVVVGGGPTGVELAGTIAEVARTTMAQDFRNFDPRSARVLLVEGSERVLQSFPTELSDAAKHQLERLGVEVVLGRRVEAIDAEGVRIGEERIAARTVLWGAGVRASPLLTTLDVPLDRAGRVPVRDDLSIDGDDRVFVIGDAAAIAVDGKPVPGVAPAAMQMGRHAGENVVRFLRERTPARLSLRRQGFTGDDRTQERGRGLRPLPLHGLPRVVPVARDPHRVPDRVPQSLRRAVRVGLGVRHVPARRPRDPRARGVNGKTRTR